MTPPPHNLSAIAEQAATALEAADNLTRITADIAARLIAIEQALPATTPGDTRSDYRFDQYPTPTTDTDAHNQLERIRAAWQRLHTWVDWLVATYRLTSVIPPCWPEHATIIEELIGLRISWAHAWTDTAPPDAILTWHERLTRARARLADGNWGHPRCDGTHDGTGLDLADQHNHWATAPTRDAALIAARDRALHHVNRPGD